LNRASHLDGCPDGQLPACETAQVSGLTTARPGLQPETGYFLMRLIWIAQQNRMILTDVFRLIQVLQDSHPAYFCALFRMTIDMALSQNNHTNER